MNKIYIPSRNVRAGIVIFLIGVVSFTFLSSNNKDFKIAKNLDIFVTLFQQVDLFYVDEKDPEDLINSSIEGMLKSLDPYTSYIPESDMDDFRFMTTGQYGGIGALIRKAGKFTLISEPYEGFPAQKAGLRAGDTLISIDNVLTNGKSVSQVSDLLKGTPNTELNLRVKRQNGDLKDFSFQREKITIPNVPYYGLQEGNIGYIRLSSFTKNAGKEVRSAFNDLKAEGAESIILDLRGNPGGLLNESVEIANIWVDKGQKIVYTHGKAKQWDHEYFTTRPAEDTLMPIAILVNRGSASASEIVAGSLQDLDRAIVIGDRTFGKGLVQTTRPLSYNTHLKITTAKYYIPSGRCIQALDYKNRNDDGSVGHVPDSLISEFKTRNGRTVKDGGGIRPDLKVEMETPANITISLFTHNLFFDFATQYAAQNESILPIGNFEITDELYEEFIAFLNDKDFNYNTRSVDELDALTKITKREGYYSIVKNEIESLREKLSADKAKDLQTFEPEISELLQDEIISRYYYQRGRILNSLKNDAQFDKAIEMLRNPGTVSAILHGVSQDGEIKLALEKEL